MKIAMPEVILETDAGSFALDAMSGGIASVFSIAWQINMFDTALDHFTVIIDEPENHLHPTMQRSLLPSFAEAFPNARFIVASHSPFIVSSFRKSHVIALDYNENRRVESFFVDETGFSGSANTILRKVLGVDSTLPIWVEDEIRARLSQNSHLDPKQQAEAIMSGLREIGIGSSLGEFDPE